MGEILIRAVEDADVAAVAAIYGHHASHGLGTFEETPPTAEAMAGRIAAIGRLGLPWLVAEQDGRILGFAYASAFRPRPGYRHTAEDSVYVAPDAIGQGVGRALLSAVVSYCEAMGLRQLLAVIGDSGNAASIGLHRALGFELIGVARGVGFKHGRWVDIVWMGRALNGGDQTLPTVAGLPLFEV
jgi:phosphinothricin acetyltransferase